MRASTCADAGAAAANSKRQSNVCRIRQFYRSGDDRRWDGPVDYTVLIERLQQSAEVLLELARAMNRFGAILDALVGRAGKVAFDRGDAVAETPRFREQKRPPAPAQVERGRREPRSERTVHQKRPIQIVGRFADDRRADPVEECFGLPLNRGERGEAGRRPRRENDADLGRVLRLADERREVVVEEVELVWFRVENKRRVVVQGGGDAG